HVACDAGSKEQQLTGSAEFAQWYRDVPGDSPSSNKTILNYPIPLTETPPGSGVFQFNPPSFFPIDDGKVAPGATWGNQPIYSDNSKPHNFGFTTEMNFNFVYRSGEVFTFYGDDDLWVFIEKHLALDIGGVHPKVQKTLRLSVFAAEHPLIALTEGGTYRMDLFGAERHTVESNFTVNTTIECIKSIPPIH
ncbi:MAG TPA: fibro-slime domain-containing protein, partial [Polyangiaceae bacterium]|nr:fibro-slime domain-containing protein [Polyangiaceae bacterium]